jgi:hypothetical protein
MVAASWAVQTSQSSRACSSRISKRSVQCCRRIAQLTDELALKSGAWRAVSAAVAVLVEGFGGYKVLVR